MPVKKPESSTEMSYKYEIGELVLIIGTEPSGYVGAPYFVSGMELAIGKIGQVTSRYNNIDSQPAYGVQIKDEDLHTYWNYAECWLEPAHKVSKDSWEKLIGGE